MLIFYKEDLNEAYLKVVAHELDLLVENPCPFTAAAYLDVLNLFEAAALAFPSLGTLIVKSSAASKYAVQGDQDDFAWLKYASPVLRESLALHQALQWLLQIANKGNGASQLQEVLRHLREQYPPTCVSVLEALVNIAPNLPLPAVLILGDTLCHLACVSNGNSIEAVSRRLLVLLYERTGDRADVFSSHLSPTSIKDSFLAPGVLPPSFVENTLLLWGPLIEQSWHNALPVGNNSWTLGSKALILALRPFLHESRVRTFPILKSPVLTISQPFDLRYAAASCLNKMPSIWAAGTLDTAITGIQLHAILMTYDILNDDDEELRDIGSSIASKILAQGIKQSDAVDMVPLVASQKLAGHLVEKHRNSQELCHEATERMTGSRFLEPGSGCLYPSSADKLDNATKEDTALFVVEKQNLFVDEVREAILWSQVLKKLSTKAIASDMARSLTEWVTSGLCSLIQRMEEEQDGPLGWCSKPDVFLVFIQIVCAADVLMTWRLRTKKVNIKGSEIREALVRLLNAGLKNGLHEMLVAKIEKVIMESTMARIEMMWERLTAVERNILEPGNV
jgi:hypothetical protein